ncbi:MAG TPA: hypothetical protein VJB59_07930, partial [Bdellovibrionota bacterium]|nr:hypothetical protein [Bdellovibrionota bacterium]
IKRAKRPKIAASAAVLKRNNTERIVSLRIGEHAVRFGLFARAFAVLGRKYWRVQASVLSQFYFSSPS